MIPRFQVVEHLEHKIVLALAAGSGGKSLLDAVSESMVNASVQVCCARAHAEDRQLARELKTFGFKREGEFSSDSQESGDVQRIVSFALDRNSWEKWIRTSHLEGSWCWLGRKASERFKFSRDEIAAFAAVSGDRNPVHLDKASAVASKFGDVICHGMLVASVFSRLLGTALPGYGTIYKHQTLSFLRPVYPDAELVCQIEVVTEVGRELTLETTVLDDDGNVYLEGEAVVLAPRS